MRKREVEDAGDAAEEQLEDAHERREAQAPALRVAGDDGARDRLEQGDDDEGAEDEGDALQPSSGRARGSAGSRRARRR